MTVGARREWWSSEWQLWTTGVRDQERLSKIRARLRERNRLVLTLGWTDERRRRTCEQQVFHRKVLRVSRVNPVPVQRPLSSFACSLSLSLSLAPGSSLPPLSSCHLARVSLARLHSSLRHTSVWPHTPHAAPSDASDGPCSSMPSPSAPRKPQLMPRPPPPPAPPPPPPSPSASSAA